MLEVQRLAAREPLTNIKLIAALKRARADQECVATCLALRQRPPTS